MLAEDGWHVWETTQISPELEDPDFPNSTNCGYRNEPDFPGTLLDGSAITVESDTTYSYYDFDGLAVGYPGADVENVTFVGCRFSGAHEVLVLLWGSNITFEYCSFEPGTDTTPVDHGDGYQYGISSDGAYATHVEGLTIDHCDFWGYANAVTIGFSSEEFPVVITDTWFHDSRADGGEDHTDGPGDLQGLGDISFVTIDHCSIVDNGNTNGIAFQYGPYFDFTVTNNRIGGWGYAVAIGGAVIAADSERITFTGNRWTEAIPTVFGPIYPSAHPFYAGDGSVWADNIWEPTGQYWTPTGPSDTDYAP
jgi:hypothetical protein